MEPRSPLAQPPGHRISRILGHAFRPRPLPENASHPEARFRDTVSVWSPDGKACPVPRAHSGMQFPPEMPPGKRIPFWSRIPGRSFRLRADPETASHSEAEIWNALSAKGRKRKAHPIPSIKSGRASLSPLAHLGKRDQLDVSPTLRGIPTSLRKATF